VLPGGRLMLLSPFGPTEVLARAIGFKPCFNGLGNSHVLSGLRPNATHRLRLTVVNSAGKVRCLP
jgi:hypothetical protein